MCYKPCRTWLLWYIWQTKSSDGGQIPQLTDSLSVKGTITMVNIQNILSELIRHEVAGIRLLAELLKIYPNIFLRIDLLEIVENLLGFV